MKIVIFTNIEPFYRSRCPRWTVALFNFYITVHKTTSTL